MDRLIAQSAFCTSHTFIRKDIIPEHNSNTTMFMPSNETRRKKTACVNCYEGKKGCDFIESMATCRRCLTRGLQCVPRVSRQGQRPNRRKKEEATAVTSTGGQKIGSQILESQNYWQDAGSSSSAAAAATLTNGYVRGIEQLSHLQQLQGISFNDAANQIQQCQPMFPSPPDHQKDLQAYGEIMSQTVAAVQLQNAINSNVSGCDLSYNDLSSNCFTQNMGSGSSLASRANQFAEVEQMHSSVDCNMNSTSSLSTLMPFKQWIKNALAAVRVSDGSPLFASEAFLLASLKIAISLTRQFVSNECDAAPISFAADWAAQTVISLFRKEKIEGQSQKEQELSSTIEDNHANGVDEELEAIFKSRNVGELKIGDPVKSNAQAALKINEISGDIDQKIEIFLKSFDSSREDKKLSGHNILANSSSTDSLDGKDHSSSQDKIAAATPYETLAALDVFDIESAEVLCPKRGPNSIESINDDKQEIYYIGLIFYELFSGGELPQRSLYSLASFENAFVSLSTLTLVEQDNPQEIMANESKRCRGQSKSESNIGLCQISCEYLRLRGVPSPVCSLIGNMLDCVYGESAGKEVYTNLADVMADLQLMMTKPEKFLRGLNTIDMTLTGLPMHEFVVPREEGMNIIKSCYNRSIAGSHELAIIKGESGSGKSYLAQSVGNFIISEGGLFLSGKFCQMRQGVPFSALTSAFDLYCDVLMQNEQTSWARSVIKGLKDALAKDAVYLIRVIPKLGNLLDHDTSAVATADIICDDNPANASKRLHYLFCRFVEVMTTLSDMPVALHLDDLQWADDASVAVLNQILRQKYDNFFFLGCYRDDDILPGHPVLVMLENVRTIGVNPVNVELKGIDVDTLNFILSNIMCISPRMVWPLSSIIHTKTRGNILFVLQVLLSLYRDRLLVINHDRQRWMWDEDEIVFKKLPDDVAACFANGITKLPLELQVALHTLSVIGSSVKVGYIQVLESQLGLNLSGPLERSASEGLTSKLDGFYHFCHDKIQETSYNLVGDPVRQNSHLMYGRCLVQHSIDTSDWDLFYVAVNQINFAGPAVVSNPLDRITMAKHNLDAGKRSMAMPDFSSAYSFFDNGISFLGEENWRNQYSFSIELHELAAKTALATGNIQRVSVLSDRIFKKATSFVDTLNAHFIVISSLISTSKVQIAMEKSIAILSHLGEDIPSDLSSIDLKHETQQIINSVTGIFSNIMDYKTMTDDIKLNAMKFLSQLILPSHHANPALFPLLVNKMMRLTVLHGKYYRFHPASSLLLLPSFTVKFDGQVFRPALLMHLHSLVHMLQGLVTLN